MSNQLANNQVLTALQLGMTPEEIAADLGYDIVAVKAVVARLMETNMFQPTGTETVDGLVCVEPSKVFDENEERIARNTIVELASAAETEGIKLEASKFIINERKGRHDVAKQMAANGFNIAVVNAATQRARIAMDKTRAKVAAEREKKDAIAA